MSITKPDFGSAPSFDNMVSIIASSPNCVVSFRGMEARRISNPPILVIWFIFDNIVIRSPRRPYLVYKKIDNANSLSFFYWFNGYLSMSYRFSARGYLPVLLS
jgi:hypothetical protein